LARVTSGLWVGAFIRRCIGEGIAAVVARRGAEEAGAILVIVDRLDGTSDLYGPAPQTAFDQGVVTDRLFQRLLERASAEALRDRLGREQKFDPDVWIVAIEDREGRARLDVVV
jgi:hypothetical protein